jgi:hypothetical protein
MLFTIADPLAVPAGHAGYIAGRYRDGAYSDGWTDVSRCAENTFVAYAPACSCGWRGRGEPASAAGRLRCRRAWTGVQLAAVCAGSATGPAADAVPA